jgi:glycogen debranching enzyme
MPPALLTILEGSTFCVSDELGDIVEETAGFFAWDTRFLSRLVLRVDGARPLPLSAGRLEHFSAAFYLRNPRVDGIPSDSLSIARERFVATGMQERIVVRNESMSPLAFELSLEVGADFADIISVKLHDFALGDPEHAPALPPLAPVKPGLELGRILIEDPQGEARTQIVLSQPGTVDGNRVVFPLELDPHARWELVVDVLPSLRGAADAELEAAERREEEREILGDVLSAWTLRVPKLRGGWEALRRAFEQSVSDLAALRIRSGEDRRPLFAAGMPWFMTVFGRDTAITSLQTFLLGPELAVGSLDALAGLQAEEDDPTIDAEPGKIVHEVRHGRAAETWFARYYGSVDSTPLFLVLLAETFRWTDDTAVATRLRQPALKALEWIDRYGDRDRDGFVEYCRRTERGLFNQSWKDSGDSQRFHDGRMAEPPIAPVEVQGYVYAAKRGLAEVALKAWRDPRLAERLEREAEELKARFDQAFWVEERGGFYALALDAEKRPVDARTSNMGHLLWTGILPPERADLVAYQLLSETLWSGWGIRTMASDEAAFNPLSYHNGTVWPHDSAFAAWGLARTGHPESSRRVARALIEAAGHFEWSLPEVFAGFARTETPFPIAYPTAARPQAWAAGTPILLLRVLLGLEPDRPHQRLVTTVEDELPSWLDGLRLEGARAFGRTWTVSVERGRVTVAEGP